MTDEEFAAMQAAFETACGFRGTAGRGAGDRRTER